MILRSKYFLLLSFHFSFCLGQNISLSHSSGFYHEPIYLDFGYPLGFDLRYTVDGNDPVLSSPLFTEPIVIQDRSHEDNTISLIPTNPSTTADYKKWTPPKERIFKSTILKYALFDDSEQITPTFISEYFIGEDIGKINLPIISIITDSSGLFDFETGIYVPGKDFQENQGKWQPGNYFNRGSDWERRAIFSYYENQIQKIEQNVEIEIHGGASREYPCKSLRISAKEKLETKYFEYPFFADKSYIRHKKIILRNAGQDFSKRMFADVLMHNLIKDLNLEIQASSPVVVFLNGSYWGIHNMREHYNKHYFENYHDEDKDLIDYFKIQYPIKVQEGSETDYFIMNDQLLNVDLSKSDEFNLIADQIDIDNYIDHHISKVYGGGTDWVGNNERVWRTQFGDSKWRWVATDYDDAFLNIEKDSYGQATQLDGPIWPNPEWSTRLFRSLMTSKIFRRKYEKRLEELLNTVFLPSNVVEHVDSLTEIYEWEISNHINRWNYPPSENQWRNEVEKIKLFANHRSDFVRNNYRKYFPEIYLNPPGLLIYPNPITSYFYIETPEISDYAEVQIINALGRKFKSISLLNDKLNHINSVSWSPGFYILNFFSSDGSIIWSEKILKQ